MKQILMMLLGVSLAIGASAQKRHTYARVYRPTRVIVVPSVAFGYGIGYGNPYMNPYFGSPYGYPYRYNNPQPKSKLDLQIESIKADYSYRIKGVRKNRSLDKNDRKQQILQLKAARDQEIIEAKKTALDRTRSSQRWSPEATS